MFARTERLLLRPGWREDAPALAKAISDEAIVKNLALAPWPYRQSDAELFLSAERGPQAADFLLFRRTGGSPQLIGGAGFGRTPEGEAELGYWIARPFWGLGYATEATRAVIDIARDTLRLKRIVAGHFLDNPASGRVLAKLGFRPTGRVLPRYSVGRGASVQMREMDLVLAGAGTRATADEEQSAEAACPAKPRQSEKPCFNFEVVTA